MKNYLFLLLIPFCLFFPTAAGAHNTFDKMVKVNKEWLKQEDVDKNKLEPFEGNTTDCVAHHLNLVEQQLRSRSTKHLTSIQQKNRAIALNHLREYSKRRAFPINDKYAFQTPIFIDQYDNFCAVGYLIKATGYESISRMIAANTNLAYVRDMSYPELLDWARTFGFTVEELAWIQPGYDATKYIKPVGNGVNGPVNKSLAHDGKLYIIGSFDTADNTIAANNVAYLTNDGGGNYTYHAMSEGVTGNVNAITEHGGSIYIGGNFATGADSSVAYWNGTDWNSMGCIKGEVKDILFYNDDLYAVGSFNICAGAGFEPTSFAKWNGETWEHIEGVNGTINTAYVFDDELYLGGSFTCNDSLTTITKWSVATGFHRFQIDTMQEINDIETAWNSLYAIGKHTEGVDLKFSLLKLTDSWQPLSLYYEAVIPREGAIEFKSLNNIEDNLYIAGNFSYMPGIFNANACNIFLMNDSVVNYHDLLPDGTINYISNFDNKLFAFGNFSECSYRTPFLPGTTDVNNIGFIDVPPTSLDNPKNNAVEIVLYPNPVDEGQVFFDNNINATHLQISDISSRIVKAHQITRGINTIDTRQLPKGVYAVSIVTDKGARGHKKLVIR